METTQAKPAAFQPAPRTKLGVIVALVLLAHIGIITVFFMHFNWKLGHENDGQSGLGQTGVVIPVSLETNENSSEQTEDSKQAEKTKSDTAKKPELVPPPEPEPVPEPVPEPAPVPAPEPVPEPVPAKISAPTPENTVVTASKPERETITTLPAADISPEGNQTPASQNAPTSTPVPAPVPTPAPAPVPAPASALVPAHSTNSDANNSITGAAGQPNNPLTDSSALTTSAQIDPNYLHRPDPIYPALSKRRQEQGKVILRVSLDAQGVVSAIFIQQSSGYPRLDQAALDAVKQWRFLPAKRGQEPVASTVQVPIDFKYQY